MRLSTISAALIAPYRFLRERLGAAQPAPPPARALDAAPPDRVAAPRRDAGRRTRSLPDWEFLEHMLQPESSRHPSLTRSESLRSEILGSELFRADVNAPSPRALAADGLR